MNATLQCLAFTPLLKSSLSTPSASGSLHRCFLDVLKDLKTFTTAVSPLRFKHQLSRVAPQFAGYAQHDAHEFLRTLLHAVHDELNIHRAAPSPPQVESKGKTPSQLFEAVYERWKKMEDSPVYDVFQGWLRSTLVCCDCQRESISFEPFLDLALPLPTSSFKVCLEDCLDTFMKAEVCYLLWFGGHDVFRLTVYVCQGADRR